MVPKKPKIAVFKFASCDGCQLSLLDAEDELLLVAGAVEIANFLEASRRVVKGPYDIGLVEGSITTPHDVERVREIRKECRVLITIGACATAGGIQAVGSYVHVDFELRGCPINKYQLLEVLNAFLNNRKPTIPTYSVCMECKLKGTVCVMVAGGTPCLGPATQAGCGALCPSYARGCYGCFGPMENPNTSALSRHFTELGESNLDIMLAFRGFNAYAEAFRKESDAHE
jgi:coenzyme F420-reducing hydrogenase gamma subunit